MPVYDGNSKAKDLYYGGTKIKEAYYGSTKVYSSRPLYYCYKWSYNGTKYLYFRNELKTVGQTEDIYGVNSSNQYPKATSSSQLSYIYYITVTSVSGNSVTATDDTGLGVRYDLTRDASDDLYT